MKQCPEKERENLLHSFIAPRQTALHCIHCPRDCHCFFTFIAPSPETSPLYSLPPVTTPLHSSIAPRDCFVEFIHSFIDQGGPKTASLHSWLAPETCCSSEFIYCPRGPRDCCISFMIAPRDFLLPCIYCPQAQIVPFFAPAHTLLNLYTVKWREREMIFLLLGKWQCVDGSSRLTVALWYVRQKEAEGSVCMCDWPEQWQKCVLVNFYKFKIWQSWSPFTITEAVNTTVLQYPMVYLLCILCIVVHCIKNRVTFLFLNFKFHCQLYSKWMDCPNAALPNAW